MVEWWGLVHKKAPRYKWLSWCHAIFILFNISWEFLWRNKRAKQIYSPLVDFFYFGARGTPFLDFPLQTIHWFVWTRFAVLYREASLISNWGWAKSPGPLLRVRVNISAQWLIGRFVRVLHSKSGLINCAGVGRRTFLTSRILSHSLYACKGRMIFSWTQLSSLLSVRLPPYLLATYSILLRPNPW